MKIIIGVPIQVSNKNHYECDTRKCLYIGFSDGEQRYFCELFDGEFLVYNDESGEPLRCKRCRRKAPVRGHGVIQLWRKRQ